MQESPPGICLCVSCGARRGTFVINSTPDIVALLFIDLRILIKMIMMSMRMMIMVTIDGDGEDEIQGGDCDGDGKRNQ